MASSPASKMKSLAEDLPLLQYPVIMNAPMAGFAGGSLASAVTKAGGIGLIGSAFSMEELRSQLQIAVADLKESKAYDSPGYPLDHTPVGVGFLPFIAKIEEALLLVEEYKPIIVWLFATKEMEDYAEWVRRIREVSPISRVFIQTGSVAAALELGRLVKPDALVMQGSDAGGHGFQKSASIISLIPETADALKKEGFGHIPLIASGGISDGRGVAAALALGAKGVQYRARGFFVIMPRRCYYGVKKSTSVRALSVIKDARVKQRVEIKSVLR